MNSHSSEEEKDPTRRIQATLDRWCSSPQRILDLGCGNGILGKFLLTRFPSANGLFLDFSDPMLDAARQSVGRIANATVAKADFGSPRWIETAKPHFPFDIVVSGFAIHHQPDDRKRDLWDYRDRSRTRCDGAFCPTVAVCRPDFGRHCVDWGVRRLQRASSRHAIFPITASCRSAPGIAPRTPSRKARVSSLVCHRLIGSVTSFHPTSNYASLHITPLGVLSDRFECGGSISKPVK